VDWSFATNDAYLIRQTSIDKCQACGRIARRLDRLGDLHQVFKGGRVRLLSAGIARGHFTITSDHVVRTRIRQERGVLVGSHDSDSRLKESVVDSLVFVTWIGSGWSVVEVGEPA
jgi:hypothetical protein